MKEEKEIWFKQRKIGYGWSPATKEGWFVVFVYFAFIFFLSFGKLEKELNWENNRWDFFIPFFTATVLLIYVSWLKGEKLKWKGWRKKSNVDKSVF